MLSLLLKLKSYIPIALIFVALSAISYGWYWHSQYGKSQAIIAQQIRENATCTANNELLQSGVQRWKAAANEYDARLKRREALVAKQNAESKKRLQAILQTQYSTDCDTAIQQGMQQLDAPGFNWNNNIPLASAKYLPSNKKHNSQPIT